MRPLSLTLDGFGSYLHATELDLATTPLVAVVGPTGAGKSSLLDAVLFALYGHSRAGDIDAVIHDERDDATVGFAFALDDTPWRVTRTRIRGKRTEATVETHDGQSWISVNDGKVRRADQVITQMLGVSSDTFQATVFCGQGDSGRFTAQAGPAARKQMVTQIIGLDRFARLATAAHDAAVLARNGVQAAAAEAATWAAQTIDLEQTAAETDTLKAQLPGLEAAANAAATAAEAANRRAMQTQAAGADADALRRQRAARIVELDEQTRRQRTAHQALADAATAASHALQTADAELNEARRQARVIDRLQSEALDCDRHLHELTTALDAVVEAGQHSAAQLNHHERDATAATTLIKETDERITALGRDDTPICFTCAQPLDHDLRATLTRTLTDQRATATARYRSARRTAASVAEQRAALLTQHQQLTGTRTETDAHARTLTTALAYATAARDRIDELTARRDQLADATVQATAQADAAVPTPGTHVNDDQLRDIDTRIAQADAAAATADKAARDAAMVGTAAKQARHNHTAVLGRLAQLQERNTTGRRAQAGQAKAQQRADELGGHAEIMTTLAKACGRDGIPTLILQAVIPELENHINDILSSVSEGRLTVEVTTTATRKSGTIADTLDLTIRTDLGHLRPYEACSGGERFLIDLAAHLGLARLLTRRRHSPLQWLAVDEGFGSLDDINRHAVVQTLAAVQAAAGGGLVIWAITHIPEVAAAFPARVEILKSAYDGSNATLTSG